MTTFHLILRNLRFHWRGNLAVFLGVIVGTAVLTGALLVGDSLRGSLRDLTLRRLGWVDEALIAPRFFREALAKELSASSSAERLCPAMLLQATATAKGPNDTGSSIRRVTVVGVDRRFFAGQPFPEHAAVAWLNSTLAHDLKVQKGSRIALTLQKPSDVPRESLLGRRKSDEVVNEIVLDVDNVLSPDDALDPFSLRPSLDPPRTAFVPLDMLQAKLGLAGRVNAILAGQPKPTLADDLRNHLELEDWGLVLHDPEERVRSLFAKIDLEGAGKLQPRAWRGRLGQNLIQTIQPQEKDAPTRAEVSAYYHAHRNYLTLESSQLILEQPVATAAQIAAKDANLRAAPTLVYLANTIGSVSDSRGAAAGPTALLLGIPYSIVAALDPTQPPPLGPFLPKGVEHLSDDEIVLADWKDSPLHAQIGDNVFLTYFEPEHQGEPRETTAHFRLAGFVPLEGAANDPDLTPAFPGVTDKLSMTEWNPPFPYDNSRIRTGDVNEKYWEAYRTTPKAYITLAAGQRLWGSRFGKLTSIRLVPNPGGDLATAEKAFRRSLMAQLKPQAGGFVFQPVKADALAASAGGTDFSMLFLGFSFFLIAAALLLIGLLVRLNLERRASEVGLLFATGFGRAKVETILFAEGAVVAAAGTVVGSVVAVLYSGLLVRFLGWVWPGGTLTSLLQPHVGTDSLIYGIAGSLLATVVTIGWGVLQFGRVPPSALLAGQTTVERVGPVRRGRWALWLATASAVGALALLAGGGFVTDDEMKASSFFGGGMLLLTACLGAVWVWMHRSRPATVMGRGWWNVGRLGVRNAALHPLRSLLTCGLLASAAFVVVAVQAFHREPDAADASRDSPSGGFSLLAESDLPLFQDLNSSAGQEELLNQLDRKLAPTMPFAERQPKTKEMARVLERTHFYAFRVRAGDDASCLNLYQPRQPRVLGVPSSLIDRGGFRFASTTAATAEERTNPWLILRRNEANTPAFGEQNTVVWMLHSGQGKEYPVPDEAGTSQPLRIDGLLQDSVFQSGLLVSEEHFLQRYPTHEGYNFVLIETPPEHTNEVKELLEIALADRGIEVTRTADRLASYLAVENTYLSTFQALGGLGLVLGSLGLGVVLLRGVWERRGELALLRALGFRRATLGWLVLSENGFLLVLGLGIGAFSALAGVLPHLLGGSGHLPWMELIALFVGVLAVGLAAGTVAVVGTLRAPLIPALRRE